VDIIVTGGTPPVLAAKKATNTIPIVAASVMDEKTAYILAGSFVGFLIERYGLPPFRSLYETENYEQAYSRSLGTLEKEWRLSLQGK
jgi:hypothetical protein